MPKLIAGPKIDSACCFEGEKVWSDHRDAEEGVLTKPALAGISSASTAVQKPALAFVSSAVIAVPKSALASVSSANIVVPSGRAVLSDVVKKKQQRKKPGIVRTIKGSGSNKDNVIAPLRQKEMPDIYAKHPDIRPMGFKDPKDNIAKTFEPFLPKNYYVIGIFAIQELCQLFHFVSL
jgi:hypothetical protein